MLVKKFVYLLHCLFPLWPVPFQPRPVLQVVQVPEQGNTVPAYLFVVLARNGGKVPALSGQKYNKYLKELCQVAGIDTKSEYFKGGNVGG